MSDLRRGEGRASMPRPALFRKAWTSRQAFMADNEDFEALLAQFEREQAGSAKVEHKVGDQVRGKSG